MEGTFQRLPEGKSQKKKKTTEEGGKKKEKIPKKKKIGLATARNIGGEIKGKRTVGGAG